MARQEEPDGRLVASTGLGQADISAWRLALNPELKKTAFCGRRWMQVIGKNRRSLLTYFVKGIKTVRLTSSLTGWDSLQQVNLLLIAM